MVIVVGSLIIMEWMEICRKVILVTNLSSTIALKESRRLVIPC